MLTNGHILSRSLNVIKATDGENVSTGFGFRITNNDALELYKYDAFNNFTQRIAIFGDGGVIKDDAYESFPIYGTSNYQASNQIVIGNEGVFQEGVQNRTLKYTKHTNANSISQIRKMTFGRDFLMEHHMGIGGG